MIEGDKCVKMLTGTWDWVSARTQCNNLNPRSHPVILNDILDAELMKLYCNAEGQTLILNVIILD